MDNEFAESDLAISDVIEVLQGADPNFIESSSQKVMDSPRVEIIEQPAPKALRFRYECEGRSAGSIPGENTTNENKTFPTIKVLNYSGPCMVVVSCVTKDEPFLAHPHNLVGKDCKQGVCTTHVDTETMTCQFPNLGIQCVKKKEVERSLEVRQKIRVDPFRRGFAHGSQPSNIDLNAVRLCFQVFTEGDKPNTFTKGLPPVASNIIYDKKANTDLQITRLSDVSCSVAGGKEIILLCEKVAKDDIDVHFTEEKDGQIVWHAKGEFQPSDVHRQYAIPFRTPAYHNLQVQHEVKLKIQLVRPSDGATSEKRDFTYLPLDSGRPFWALKKLKADYDTFSKILATNTALMTAPRSPIAITNGIGGPSSEVPVQEVPEDLPQEVKIEPVEEKPGPVDEPVYEYSDNSWDKSEQRILESYSDELAQDENCKSLNDLLSTVAELEEMYSEPPPDPELTECLKQSADSVPATMPMDVDESYESGHYTSLQLAMKNPILIDIDFEDPPAQTLILPAQSDFILAPMNDAFIPQEQPNNKREGTTDKLPPLPPKRFRKGKDDDSGSIITIDEPAPELPPRANPPPANRTGESNKEKQKPKNFFQKLFSRKGGRKNKPPGLPKSGSVPCNLSEVNQNSIGMPPSPVVDLTEAEHYALYTDVAPRANCSEFDETSFYYSPVEGIAEKPLPPEPQKSEKRSSVSKISGSIKDMFS